MFFDTAMWWQKTPVCLMYKIPEKREEFNPMKSGQGRVIFFKLLPPRGRPLAFVVDISCRCWLGQKPGNHYLGLKNDSLAHGSRYLISKNGCIALRIRCLGSRNDCLAPKNRRSGRSNGCLVPSKRYLGL